jgi:hypothetical protein
MIMRLSFCNKKPYNPKIHPPKVECSQRERERERERERIHTIYKQMNIMLCARQTLELCANPSCPNPNNFACELFGGGGCRQYLRISLRCFTCRPHNWVLYIHTSRMREAGFEKGVLSWVESGWQLKAKKLQTCCMNVCMYVCTTYHDQN